MIALKILYYILEEKDPILFNKIDFDWILDKRVQDLYKQVLDFYEKSSEQITERKLPDVKHLIDYNNDPLLFEDITKLSRDSIEFYINQLEERYHKYKYLDSLYKLFVNSDVITFDELINEHQNILLTAQKQTENTLNEIDCSISPDPEELIFKLPTGLQGFDKVNGGIASSELMLIGGYRGTGKSILALHCAISRFRRGKTAAFISIEMRSVEVCNRIDAMITKVPIKAIETNAMTQEQLKQFYTEKTRVFCKKTEETQKFLKYIETTPDIIRGKAELIYRKLPRKENKLYLYDLPTCSPTNINYIASKLKHTQNLSLLVVDYLNIIKMPNSNSSDYDPLGWKAQIARSEFLKTTARINDIAIISPMQISDEGKIKFARAIEDAVDVSLLFEKKSNVLSLRTSKIRNGKDVKFTLLMDEENLTIQPFRKEHDD